MTYTYTCTQLPGSKVFKCDTASPPPPLSMAFAKLTYNNTCSGCPGDSKYDGFFFGQIYPYSDSFLFHASDVEWRPESDSVSSVTLELDPSAVYESTGLAVTGKDTTYTDNTSTLPTLFNTIIAKPLQKNTSATLLIVFIVTLLLVFGSK